MVWDGGASSALRTPVESASRSRSGRERVNEIQRARMFLAMAEIACERGVGDVSVAHVVERAGVSRRTFYELFEDREDCFLAAFGEAVARAERYVVAASDPGAEWSVRTRDALVGLLSFLDEEPAFGRLAIVESLGAGARALDTRRDVVARVVAGIDAARHELEVDSSVTALTAEGVVGGVLSVMHARLVSNDSESFVTLAKPLMSMIVLPYLGVAAARKELERPDGEALSPALPGTANPLRSLKMSLTYRTVRVLTAIVANQGASNRVIGDAAGVNDQGQISKLLARLEKLGLVRNDGGTPAEGGRNAWMLTKQGEEVADVIATRTARS